MEVPTNAPPEEPEVGDEQRPGDPPDSDSLRPLPFLDMPLLKEERRAVRSKQALGWVAFVAVALGAIVAVTLWWRAPTGPEPRRRGIQAPAAAVPAAPPLEAETPTPAEVVGAAVEATSSTPTTLGAVERTSRPFGKARSFHHALTGFGIGPEAALAIEQALQGLLDFRRCQPQDTLVLERNDQGEVVLFEYHGSPTEYVRASREEPSMPFVGSRETVPVERTRIRKGGVVQQSLGNSLAKAGLGRSLVGRFIEAFQRHIRFSTQTRTGDAFRIIVDEERVNGEFLGYGTVYAVEYDGQRTGTLRAYWFEPDGDGHGDFFDESGHALYGSWLRTPLRYDRISSMFNMRRRHPILKRIVPHTGVDYAAGTGTPVWAGADGTVTFAGPKGANGNLVGIRHADGYETYYAHLHRIQSGIKPGTKVRQRQVIGAVGSTGRSTGPHLHFGLKKGGRFVDPLEVINGPGKPLPASQKARFQQHLRRLSSELERIPIDDAAFAIGERPPGVEAQEPEDVPMD
ncbi:MAG: M23 family metallopeptidase [Myxococcales bacterium]|nr:M23 family metallopeptidase [Myxococcales bacterium]